MAKKHLKKAFKILVVLMLVIFIIARGKLIFWKVANKYNTYVATKQNEEVLKEIKNTQTVPNEERTSNLLNVEFICQAPLQTVENWKLHENSCEEAAVLQAYLYEKNKTMTKLQANDEILKMIEWEKQNFGGHKDLYADALKEFINGYYAIPKEQIKIKYDASLRDIKNIIDSGHPVIVPIMGDVLKNPNYPYPDYHMLIVTGYTKDMIVTNDNGTRKGESYSYPNDRFLKAMQAAGGDIVSITTTF